LADEKDWWDRLYEDWINGTDFVPVRPDRGWRSIGEVVNPIVERLRRARGKGRDAWLICYREYLASPEWQVRRQHVLERSRGVCEGCREQPASEVHHLTYDHVGEEFLWELEAVCDDCHSRVHGRPP
jgi:5-methylcytosine-specific restriction endonuclease McrA